MFVNMVNSWSFKDPKLWLSSKSLTIHGISCQRGKSTRKEQDVVFRIPTQEKVDEYYIQLGDLYDQINVHRIKLAYLYKIYMHIYNCI